MALKAIKKVGKVVSDLLDTDEKVVIPSRKPNTENPPVEASQPTSPNECHDPQYNRNLSPPRQAVNEEYSSNFNNVNEELRIANGTISICCGDLTEQQVDAIVVASTSGRLTQHILTEAGESVATLYTQRAAEQPNRLVCTSGGNLPCRRIYFIPCPRLSRNADESVYQDFIETAVKTTMRENNRNIHSIAVPAIGCGLHRCDVNFVAATMIDAAVDQLNKHSSLQLSVRFVIENTRRDVLQAFQTHLNGLVQRARTNFVRQTLHHAPQHLRRLSRAHSSLDSFEIQRQQLSTSDPRYIEVVELFRSTMKKDKYTKIIHVEMIINKRWYEQYQIHAREFRQRLGEDTECLLFHGCSEDAANGIIKEYFNRSYAGEHGVLYGHGAYFSSQAGYSHNYATPNAKGERCMFLALVLVGRTTKGNSSMKICPMGYDSTTDGSHIFVTYLDTQAFAKYLITYK